MAKEKVWTGETKCNICGKEIEDLLYDCKTICHNWAVLCPVCWSKYGLNIGQKYQKDESGRFVKIGDLK